MENLRNYLGFDIGTDSVGWAVTDGDYKLRRYKGNLMWGVNIFDAANQSSDRRMHRTARRRFDRRKQRISLLQDFFAPEILKIDRNFFMRLKESALFPEDSKSRNKNIFFDDENYGDKDYFGDYPTIHHLICELMVNNTPHDIRLVYLACAYILAHRGHFLSEIDKDNISEINNFDSIFNSFNSWFDSYGVERPFECSSDDFSKVLKSKLVKTKKEKEFKSFLFNGNNPPKKENYPVNVSELLKLICGGTSQLSKLFENDEYSELENNSICVSSVDFVDKLEGLSSQIDVDHAELLGIIKMVYDWSLLTDIMGEYNYISKAKVDIYERHKSDLTNLKYICRKYLLKEKYNEIFREASDKANYVSYSYNTSSINGIPVKFKKTNQEEFCKYIYGCIKDIAPNDEDQAVLNELIKNCESNSLCPKQVNTDNRVIPYQLNYVELKKILENASGYLPLLKTSDEYGTVADKILSIMEFRIPYYVGPLVGRKSSDNVWIERKAEGKTYPWNFDRMVDHDKTENAFIRRMTCKCTYLAGMDVLPKNSLLNSKFNVLNEINKIAVNGNPITVEQKQGIYNALFVNEKKRVTKKRIAEFLISEGIIQNVDGISGIDDTVKSSLKPYHDFKKLMENGVLTQNDVEDIINHITVTTDKMRFKRWIKENYPQISDKDIVYISGLKYSDYGRISRELLEEVYEINPETGEVISDKNIITRLWETNDNLMQILSGKYGYGASIEKLNADFYHENELTLEERLKEMYIPTAVKRAVFRTLDITKELRSILKKSPDKIFIEMARGNDGKTKKGSRTDSKRKQIAEIFKAAREFMDNSSISELEAHLAELSDSDLRSEKYFLYFTQLGRCMYSGQAIDFSKIGNDALYNIDHIYPQARVKDDSLDNKVLVLSSINGAKSDVYPIHSDIRAKMSGFWNSLKRKNLISEEKYKRLTRTSKFTAEELSGFINRQLVETRQSTKAVATLLKDIFPGSEIVYVKAGIVSDFRHEMDMLKCREINDLHHAKDAYLNIVMGNVCNVKFTKNPMNFVKSGEVYSMNLFKKSRDGKESGLLAHKVERNGECAWNPECSFDIVRKTMAKNSIRYVRYAYIRKGGFFNQNAERAKEGLVPRKKGLNTELYGGYNNTTVSSFALIKCVNDIIIIPLELMLQDKFLADEGFAKQYAYEKLKTILPANKYGAITADDITFPDIHCEVNAEDMRQGLFKINTVVEVNGFRINLCSKDSKGKYITVSSAVPVATNQILDNYINRLSNFKKKYGEMEVNSYDRITCEENIKIYDFISNKCITKPFSRWKRFSDIGTTLNEKRDEFLTLTVTQQVGSLLNIVSVLKCGRSVSCDLSSIGESKKSCVSKLGAVLSGNKYIETIHIIDQSPTGLLEKKSQNLLEL